MSESLFSTRDLRGEIEEFITSSSWGAEVPVAPDSPVNEWGTLAWARLALDLLKDNEHALRKAKHYVILVADADSPTGDVIGTFPSLEDARTWAMTQPGGERYWQCAVRAPE